MSHLIPFVFLAFLALVVGMQVLVRLKARAMRGKDVPALPGPLGREIAGSPLALIYFFSPSCGACKALTPRLTALRRSNPAVHLVDVTRDPSDARVFQIMGTPTVVEIADGKIAGYHVGAVPAEVLARFA